MSIEIFRVCVNGYFMVILLLYKKVLNSFNKVKINNVGLKVEFIKEEILVVY